MKSPASPRANADQPTPRKRPNQVSSGLTIVDVARAAKVSTATVSRVLGESPKVLPETRAHVLRVVAELGYSPNASAKSLRTLQTQKLLVIVPDIAEPFFALILQGIEHAASREGYAVLVGDTQYELERDQHYATMLPQREVDGLIVLSQKVPTVIKPWMDAHRSLAPVVTGFISGEEFGVSSAAVDNRAVAAEALSHLLALGHRQIGAIVGPGDLPQMQDRVRGLKEAAAQYDGLKGLSIEHGKFSIEAGIACASKLLARKIPPTAICCSSDSHAIGALEAARRVGVNVPRDLSIIGCDNLPISAHIFPPLTTIAMPMREVGRETVRLVVGALRGTLTKPASVILPVELIDRGSTAAPRAI